MKEAEMLRAIAQDLREEAVKRAEHRRTKAACVLVAASGLNMLSRKLGVSHG